MSRTSRQSQRRHLSRVVLTHASRQLPSWLTCNVSQKCGSPLESLVQIVLEVFFQVAADVICDLLSRSRNPLVQSAANSVIAAIVASLLGAVSLALHPHHVIGNLTVRLVALAAIPVLNGCLLAAIRSATLGARAPEKWFRAFLSRLSLFAHLWGNSFFWSQLNERANQSSEPTTTAVTIPAAQEVVPAAVVAHL